MKIKNRLLTPQMIVLYDWTVRKEIYSSTFYAIDNFHPFGLFFAVSCQKEDTEDENQHPNEERNDKDDSVGSLISASNVIEA